ncbi:hypothetical protein [Propionivibrio sp.]|uniref:hypothetical protein n=1 Tax=Propionivibrio sp. TaxID=2212460 RepID=UPI00272ED369|nr:hypothetical protein [Propionivibrio sp.]
MRKAILMALCVISSCASAQMVLQADSAALQPQIGRDENGFSSCGVRGVVIVSRAQYWDAYDFSAMVRLDLPYGMLKAGKSRTPAQEAVKGKFSTKSVVPPPVNFWFAQENEGKPLTPIKTIPAETKGYILELANIGDTLRGILAMIHGERMQFAIRYKNEPADVVVAFAAQMPDYERAPLMKCIKEVGNRMAKLAINK